MFSLLQALYFISTAPDLAKKFYALSISSTHEFPWMLCSINFSSWVLDMFKDKKYALNHLPGNKACSRTHSRTSARTKQNHY